MRTRESVGDGEGQNRDELLKLRSAVLLLASCPELSDNYLCLPIKITQGNGKKKCPISQPGQSVRPWGQMAVYLNFHLSMLNCSQS